MKLEFLEYLFKEKFIAVDELQKVQQEVAESKKNIQDVSRSVVERGLQRELVDQKLFFSQQRVNIAIKTIETYADTHGIEREKPAESL